MTHEVTYFPFKEFDLPAGITINEACDRLGIKATKQQYNDCLIAVGEASTIFGIDVVQYELSCYGKDGPLKEVQYLLSSNLIRNNHVSFSECLEVLERSLGPADEKSGSELVKMTSCNAYVKARASWKTKGFDIYLAIYSGIRSYKQIKPHVGQLSFKWKDVVAAASSEVAMQDKYIFSLKLDEINVKETILFKVKEQGYIKEYKTFDERRAWRALSNPKVFETPEKIKSLLREKNATLAFSRLSDAFLVSHSEDSSVLTRSDSDLVFCENVLPAKGGGGMYLSISDVRIHSPHSSKEIHAILDWLNKEMGIQVNVNESYDC